MVQPHIRIDQSSATFTMIAGRAGSHYICPGMRSSRVSRNDMIDCQFDCMFATILASISITAENFPSRQFDCRPGAMNHHVQPDDGWLGENLTDCVDFPSAVHNQGCTICYDQANSPAQIANINWFKISI